MAPILSHILPSPPATMARKHPIQPVHNLSLVGDSHQQVDPLDHAHVAEELPNSSIKLDARYVLLLENPDTPLCPSSGSCILTLLGWNPALKLTKNSQQTVQAAYFRHSSVRNLALPSSAHLVKPRDPVTRPSHLQSVRFTDQCDILCVLPNTIWDPNRFTANLWTFFRFPHFATKGIIYPSPSILSVSHWSESIRNIL